MARYNVVDKILEEWAVNQREKLSERVQQLIRLVNLDLYFGPLETGDHDGIHYSGFCPSMEEILKELDKIHTSDVWIDIQFEEVFTSEPQGFMEEVENPDRDKKDVNSEFIEVWHEPEWESLYIFDSKRVMEAILGEAAGYV